MASKLKTVESRLKLIGTSGSQSPLDVLREVSRVTPKDIKVDISDFNYTADGLRLEGTTSDFDAVNRLAREIGNSPLFAKAQVVDSKASLTGNQVDFRLNVTFSEGQDKP